jgi:CRP-like cAMP-binding protein
VQLLDSFVEQKPQEGSGLSEALVQQFMQKETWLRVITAYHLSGEALDSGTQPGELFTEDEKELYKLLGKISFLKKSSLFKDVPGNYLIPLAKVAHSVKLREGEFLFHQGDQGDAMYLICYGSISIQVNEVEVNRMGVGECIGEMALLDGAPRSASCVAEEDTELLRISDSDFEIVVKSQTNVALAVLRTLARRLHQQTANPVKPRETEDVRYSNEEDTTQQIMKKETKREKVATYHRKAPDPETQAGEMLSESEKDLYNLFERISFLKKVPLFEEIPENYLIPLAKIAHAVTLKGRETLFHQGDRGDAMYFIRYGSISVQINGVEVNRMGIGECIGEMALLDDTPRSASCIAEGDTELLRIGANDFEIVVKSQSSVVFAMLRTLAGRLRQQTADSTQ